MQEPTYKIYKKEAILRRTDNGNQVMCSFQPPVPFPTKTSITNPNGQAGIEYRQITPCGDHCVHFEVFPMEENKERNIPKGHFARISCGTTIDKIVKMIDEEEEKPKGKVIKFGKSK